MYVERGHNFGAYILKQRILDIRSFIFKPAACCLSRLSLHCNRINRNMNKQCITIHPYFDVEEGKLEEFKTIWQEILPTVQTEEKCIFYEFSFNGNIAFCREAYEDAEGVLVHLAHVGASLEKASAISKIIKLEVHGPKNEIDKLREPMILLPVEYFEVEFGFRK